MVPFGGCRTCLHPLAQFSPMVWRIMATMARSSLRGGLWLHFCGRPLICSAALHAVHLFSVLSLYVEIKSHEKENRRRQLEDEHDAGGVGAVCRVDAAGSRWHHRC